MWRCRQCGHLRDAHQFDGLVLRRCLGTEEDHSCECDGYQAKYVPHEVHVNG
jgi:hypothetical protein